MRYYALLGFIFIASACDTSRSLAQDTRQTWLYDIAYESTLVLGRVDLETIDIEKNLMVVARNVHPEVKQFAEIAASMAGGMSTQLKNAGANEIIFSVSVENIFTESAVVIPCRDTQLVANLLQLAASQIPAEYGYTMHKGDGVVALSGERTWQRFLDARAKPTNRENRELSRWSELLEPKASQQWFAISVPTRLRDELVHLWPEAISIGSATASPSQLVADIVGFRCNLSADENGVGEVYLTCLDDLAANRTMAQVEKFLEQIPDEIDGVAVPRTTVRRAGKLITLSWSNVEIGLFVSALVNAM